MFDFCECSIILEAFSHWVHHIEKNVRSVKFRDIIIEMTFHVHLSGQYFLITVPYKNKKQTNKQPLFQ